jgi:hypothetical protein
VKEKIEFEYHEEAIKKHGILNMTVNDGDKIPYDKQIPAAYLETIVINGQLYRKEKPINVASS